MQVQFSPTPGDDTAAAIVAAIACYIESDSTAERIAVPPASAWRGAGLLEAQGLPAARGATPPKWSTAERSQRATRWSAGIVGS
jgi:hypothetical protein